jgi:hypothetical protein
MSPSTAWTSFITRHSPLHQTHLLLTIASVLTVGALTPSRSSTSLERQPRTGKYSVLAVQSLAVHDHRRAERRGMKPESTCLLQ